MIYLNYINDYSAKLLEMRFQGKQVKMENRNYANKNTHQPICHATFLENRFNLAVLKTIQVTTWSNIPPIKNRQTKNVDIISFWIYHLLIQKIVHIVSLFLKQKTSDCLGLPRGIGNAPSCKKLEKLPSLSSENLLSLKSSELDYHTCKYFIQINC